MSDFRDLLPSIAWSSGGLILSLGAVVGKPLLPGFRQAVAAGLADRLAAAFVFVVRGDVADALVEPDRVVFGLEGVELQTQDRGVVDRE